MNQRNKNFYDFLVNNLLLLSGVAMIVSGFVLQIGFHMQHGGNSHSQSISPHGPNMHQHREMNPNDTVWSIDYSTWSAIHKVVIVLFSLIMIYHIVIHWKWYKGVFSRRLFAKNMQAVTLSFLFIAVALTGLVPWLIKLGGNSNHSRLFFIEIHDKLAIVLTLYLVLHVIKRIKWFSNVYVKLRKRHNYSTGI